MDTGDLAGALRVGTALLDEVVDRDWTVDVPGLTWTVAATVAHIADGLLWYATDAVAGPHELSTAEVRVRPETPPADLVRTVRTFGTVLGHVLAVAPPDTRGWHPWGVSDMAGFAAMGSIEVLVHGHDVARGLDVPFEPPAELVTPVLRRLFPEAPADTDPWQTLLWATGRQPLGDRPRREGWRWHSAPLP
ncbi:MULTISPECIES: maleylpyruvate isomerase N-terminal domain-containing protein [unclassified Saccharothrix]|uniref:maleylpyruvate isomerase N-terminal domain-containing protein n=1 Tax=unclassified Saccharothrix TaxID=2593673 RepID=UPI00307F12E6